MTIQFMCTSLLGMFPDDLKRTLVGTHAFSVDEEEWRWCLSFIRDGGKALSAYGDCKRVEWDEAKAGTLRDRRLARRHRRRWHHRLGQMIKVAGPRRVSGACGRVLHFEHGPGAFWFAGMSLEFVRLKEGRCTCARQKTQGPVPVYLGGRFAEFRIGDAIRDELDAFSKGHVRSPEMSRVSPSRIAARDELPPKPRGDPH